MDSSAKVQIDVEAAIAEFVNDGGRASLELPPMPAGQRKDVKVIADTYPDLVCESFGMGQGRCIHVFKTGGNNSSSGVTVKNTFIDDWITPAGDDDSVEPVIFRSMPSQLTGSPNRLPTSAGLSALTSKLDLSPISEGSPKLPGANTFGIACSPKLPALLGAETFGMAGVKQIDAVKCRQGEGESSGGRCGGAGGLPTLLGNFQAPQIRNTFIHIDDMSPDASNRSIQSMPHDMFRQCLQEELHQAKASATRCAGQSPPQETKAFTGTAAGQPNIPGLPTFEGLALGTQVTIQGLTKIPAFNGQSGIVERFDEATERYSVKLTTGGPGIPKFAKVKRENLCAAAASPASLAEIPLSTSGVPGSQAFFGAFADTSATRLKLTALV